MAPHAGAGDHFPWGVHIAHYLACAAASRRTARQAGIRVGLHLAADLTGRHAIEALVTVSAGSPALFYDVIWRRYEELPACEHQGEAARRYRRHLAGQAARRPASDVTTFLLGAAVADGVAR
jgi:hypothetical protein